MKILIAIPAYNEEKIIKASLLKLADFCQANLSSHEYLIVVADNNSTDSTGALVKEFALQNTRIAYLFVPQKGKGLAIKSAWQKYQDDYEIFIFMDADLATDLEALPKLIATLQQDFDLALGSRYLKDSHVDRSLFRKIFSWSYRLFLKIFLGTKIKDFPCGFKAIKLSVVKAIVPQVQNLAWFFDSELIYLAEKAGFKIKEIPVIWAEPRAKDTRVRFWHVSWQYLKEIWRLRFHKHD